MAVRGFGIFFGLVIFWGTFEGLGKSDRHAVLLSFKVTLIITFVIITKAETFRSKMTAVKIL